MNSTVNVDSLTIKNFKENVVEVHELAKQFPANYVTLENSKIIAMEAPNLKTVGDKVEIDTRGDVWAGLFFKNNATFILDVCNTERDESRLNKWIQYYPDDPNTPLYLESGDCKITVTLLDSEKPNPLNSAAFSDIQKFKVSMTANGENLGEKIISRVRYHKWPDFGVIDLNHLDQLVALMKMVEEKVVLLPYIVWLDVVEQVL